MDKAKIAGVAGIFVLVVGVILFSWQFLTTTETPSGQFLSVAEGTIKNMRYKRPRSGPTELFVTLNNSQETFELTTAGLLNIYNGSIIPNLNKGDAVKIFYNPNGYKDAIGKQNAIWKIEKNGTVFISEKEITESIEKRNKNYGLYGAALFLLGIVFIIISKFFPGIL